MKAKYIYPYLMALALASGCIKEDGADMTITRSVRDKDNLKSDTISATIVTAQNGFMDGEAVKDSVVANTFKTIINQNKIQELDCYVTLTSQYTKLNLERNAIKEAGYVYSRTVKAPVVGQPECGVFKKDFINYNPQDSTKENIEFSGDMHGLDFKTHYYIRSYVVSTKEDTIYNPRVVDLQTVLPEDVWFQRKNAPETMIGRIDAFCKTLKSGRTFVYGGRSGSQYFNDMWVYDKDHDTWTQKGSFDDSGTHYENTAKRSNGAIFAYSKQVDTLLYIAGGETRNGPTATVFYYSTEENRYANRADHPNMGRQYPQYTSDHKPVYVTDADGNPVEPKQIKMGDCTRSYVENLPIYKDTKNGVVYYGLTGCVAFTLQDNSAINGERYFIAFGKTNLTNSDPISTTIYEYDFEFDRLCNAPSETSLYAWKNVTSTTDKSSEGFYQPVCIEGGDWAVVGTGESSRGGVSRHFYKFTPKTASIQVDDMPTPPEEFTPRANAVGFYLYYTKNGDIYDRLFVGTGRSVTEEQYTRDDRQLINDFWCYDFSTNKWTRKANCSNIGRQGAVSFTTMRVDDYYYDKFGENLRGMVSFGEGTKTDDAGGRYVGYLNDNWEYLP